MPACRKVAQEMGLHGPAVVGHQHEAMFLTPDQNVGIPRPLGWHTDLTHKPDHECWFVACELMKIGEIDIFIKKVLYGRHVAQDGGKRLSQCDNSLTM
jgi:hypothetical protein